MGRIFEKRKERMFARWSKMAKAFTKIGKEIAVAVKLGGDDPAANPRLRMAVLNARALNMPKDRVEAAIKRASSKDAEDLQEITYEGYGPHGVAMFVEATTNNPTRTVANVRSYFTRHGGSLGQNGTVGFLFERKGVFRVKKPSENLDELELRLIDHGLEEMIDSGDEIFFYTDFKHFGSLQHALESEKIEVINATLEMNPTTTVELTTEQEEEVNKLIDKLEEDDDIQQVYHTMG